MRAVDRGYGGGRGVMGEQGGGQEEEEEQEQAKGEEGWMRGQGWERAGRDERGRG